MIDFRRIFAWPSRSIRARHDRPPTPLSGRPKRIRARPRPSRRGCRRRRDARPSRRRNRGLRRPRGCRGRSRRPPSSFRRSVSTTRVTWARALERWKGSRRTSQMSFHRPTWRVGVVVCHVAPVSTSVSSKEMSRMRALQSVMQSSQVPEVTALRYSLPTCVMRARICVCAAFISLSSLSTDCG